VWLEKFLDTLHIARIMRVVYVVHRQVETVFRYRTHCRKCPGSDLFGTWLSN